MITFEPLLAENCLGEIAAAGPAAQLSAQTNLGIGTPIVIQSSHITPTGSLALVLSNGTTVTVTGNIIGAPGQIGPGFSAASINSSGHLILTETTAGVVSGTTDLGNVVGAPGSNGSAGQQGPGFSDISINSSGHLIVTTTSVGGITSGTVDLGNVVGTSGTTGQVGPGFSSATINGLGHLIVTNTAVGGTVTGTTDLGNVVGTNGTNGTPGSGYISAAVNSFGHLILGQVTAGVVTGTVDLGSVVGPQGPTGPSSSNITGGTVDNTPIGSTTPSSGAFTTLSGSVVSTHGITPRTLADRFATLPTVKDNGAVGDGIAHDDLAFNATMGYGVSYIIPPGSYNFSGVLNEGSQVASLALGPFSMPSLYTFPGISSQYVGTTVGFGFQQRFTDSTGHTLIGIQAINAPTGIGGNNQALFVQVRNDATNASYGISAGYFVGLANSMTSTLYGLNPNLIYPSGTQGYGVAIESDVTNNTGTDDSIQLSATSKGSFLAVSTGSNKVTYGLQISGGTGRFQSGIFIKDSATAAYDIYSAATALTAKWYIDNTGIFMIPSIIVGGTGGPTITTGVGIPTSSANPGSVYINTNQGIPSIPQLYLNTSVGSAGVTWGQIPVLNQATTFSVSLKGHILSGAENLLDDGAGNATIVGSLTVGSNAVLTSGAATAGGAIVTIVPSGSPYVNTALARGVLFVNGGAVTSITIKRGTTAVPTGQTSGGINVVSGDQVSITYTSVPTVNFVPA